MNDFETRLSQALHTLTPEPPTSYRFAPSEESTSDADVPVDVIGLDAARRRRRPQYGALLAAAAVVVLGGGIAVVAVSGERTDTVPGTSDRPSTTTTSAPACDNGELTVSQDESSPGASPFVARVIFTNSGTRTCRLPAVPDLAVTTGDAATPSSVQDFPAVLPTPEELVLRPGGRLLFRGEMATVGTCRELREGEKATASIRVGTKDGFELSPALGVTGCRLLPVGLRVQTSR